MQTVLGWKRILGALTIVGCLANLASCSVSKKSTSNEALKGVITEKYAGFRDAMKRKDPEFFEALYTRNSVFYHLEHNTIGNTEIARDFGKMMENDVVISCQPVDVEVYGDAAFEIGNATITKGGDVIARERYIVIWKYEGGDWKIDKDIPIKVKPKAESEPKESAQVGSLLVEKYEQLAQSAPDISTDNVKVWTLKKDQTIRVNLVEMKGELTRHLHPDADHSLMVVKGKVKAEVGDRVEVLGQGDFISIPQGVPHKYTTITETALLTSMDAPYYDPAKTQRLE